MSYKTNLELSPRKFTRGGVDLYLNWCNRPDGEGTEPAYIFTRANDWRCQAVMPLSDIHRYVKSSGYANHESWLSPKKIDPIKLVSARSAMHIGFAFGDTFAANTIADMIVDYAEDLKNMPPWPPAVSVARPNQVAELEIKVDGQTVAEMEVAA